MRAALHRVTRPLSVAVSARALLTVLPRASACLFFASETVWQEAVVCAQPAVTSTVCVRATLRVDTMAATTAVVTRAVDVVPAVWVFALPNAFNERGALPPAVRDAVCVCVARSKQYALAHLIVRTGLAAEARRRSCAICIVATRQWIAVRIGTNALRLHDAASVRVALALRVVRAWLEPVARHYEGGIGTVWHWLEDRGGAHWDDAIVEVAARALVRPDVTQLLQRGLCCLRVFGSGRRNVLAWCCSGGVTALS